MRNITKLLSLLAVGATAVAAAPAVQGSFEVLSLHPDMRGAGILFILAAVTAAMFVIVLLAYGMRDPIL